MVAAWISIQLVKPMYSRTAATNFLKANTMEETNEKEKQEVSENEVIINATDKKDKQDVPENELITRIKKCLLDLYCPADNINETEFHLSSSEVYEKLISIFPYSNEFTIN